MEGNSTQRTDAFGRRRVLRGDGDRRGGGDVGFPLGNGVLGKAVREANGGQRRVMVHMQFAKGNPRKL